MPRKKVSRKKASRQRKISNKDLDINIKVNNLEKAIKCGMRKNNKKDWKCHGTGFWGFGSALAIVMSYTQNSSVLWAILHGIFSWFYILYRVLLPYF